MLPVTAKAFDMPKGKDWKLRGGWVVRHLGQDIGCTWVQAAGVTGNLGYESAGFTKLQEITPHVHGSRGGYGWAQWTGPRRVAFEMWAKGNGLSPETDEANYTFLIRELRTSYRSFTAKLLDCATLRQACTLTHRLYETPADVLDGSYRSGRERLKWAEIALYGAGAERWDA